MRQYRIIQFAPDDAQGDRFVLQRRQELFSLLGWTPMGSWHYRQMYRDYEDAWSAMKYAMLQDAARERERNYRQRVVARSQDINIQAS